MSSQEKARLAVPTVDGTGGGTPCFEGRAGRAEPGPVSSANLCSSLRGHG
jgi:hypothetical protein